MFSAAISRSTPPPWPPMPIPAMFSFSLGGMNPRPRTCRGTTWKAKAVPAAVCKKPRRFMARRLPPEKCRAWCPTEDKAAGPPGKRMTSRPGGRAGVAFLGRNPAAARIRMTRRRTVTMHTTDPSSPPRRIRHDRHEGEEGSALTTSSHAVDRILQTPFPSYHRPLELARALSRSGVEQDRIDAVGLLDGLSRRYPHAPAFGQELPLALIECGRHEGHAEQWGPRRFERVSPSSRRGVPLPLGPPLQGPRRRARRVLPVDPDGPGADPGPGRRVLPQASPTSTTGPIRSGRGTTRALTRQPSC